MFDSCCMNIPVRRKIKVPYQFVLNCGSVHIKMVLFNSKEK
jgi:hypothetical protein